METKFRIHRSDKEWERVVYAEVLIPDTPNVFGDYWTAESIRTAAYEFMKQGFGIDVDHDYVDVSGPVKVVESFIAQDGDTTFIPGSWVVGMYVGDDSLWQQVLDNEINGFSYSATVFFEPATLVYEDSGVRTGVTEPDLTDGHTHEFMVIVDDNNRPIDGGTSETNGHSHSITSHTVTDTVAGHNHRYTLVKGGAGQ